MPAIVNATVVLWKKVEPANAEPKVVYADAKLVTVYVVDESEDTDAAIIAAYILEFKDEKTADEKLAMLQAARDGLLQVIGVERLLVTPPPVPPTT